MLLVQGLLDLTSGQSGSGRMLFVGTVKRELALAMTVRGAVSTSKPRLLSSRRTDVEQREKKPGDPSNSKHIYLLYCPVRG